jgi:hypothetical protein
MSESLKARIGTWTGTGYLKDNGDGTGTYLSASEVHTFKDPRTTESLRTPLFPEELEGGEWSFWEVRAIVGGITDGMVFSQDSVVHDCKEEGWGWLTEYASYRKATASWVDSNVEDCPWKVDGNPEQPVYWAYRECRSHAKTVYFSQDKEFYYTTFSLKPWPETLKKFAGSATRLFRNLRRRGIQVEYA